jgi:hypothetical protein
MTSKPGLAFAIAALLAFSAGTPAMAAGTWDGTWGTGSPLINIKGHAIAYSYQGKSYPVSAVRMSAKQLAFHAGEANVVMTPVAGGMAHFNFTLFGHTTDMQLNKH